MRMRVLDVETGDVYPNIASAAAAAGVNRPTLQRWLQDPLGRYTGVDDEHARLQNLPVNVHRLIQERVVDEQGRRNNRALARFAAATPGLVPRLLPHVSGVRNALAIAAAIRADLHRAHLPGSPRTRLRRDAAPISSRFGVALKVTDNVADINTVYLGTLVDEKKRFVFPDVAFAGPNAPAALAVKFSWPADQTRQSTVVNTVVKCRTKDLLLHFRAEHRRYPDGISRAHPELFYLILRRADREMCEAVLRAIDQFVGRWLMRSVRNQCRIRVMRQPAETRALANALGVQVMTQNPLAGVGLLP